MQYDTGTFWSYLKQPLCSDMEGREIKRREWMRGTAAYKLRNRWIYGLMGFAIGTGALLFCLIPEDNKITRMVRREQEERDFKSKREMEINAMRAEAARMDAVESTSA